MFPYLVAAFVAAVLATPTDARVTPFPASFNTQVVQARPRAMRDAFEQFAAFNQDAIDNKALLSKGKLRMPVLALGAEKSFGAAMADDLRFVASDVTSGIVPSSGHWIMEENPQATVKLVTEFLAK